MMRDAMSAERIYDAILDDGALSELAADLAASCGARSAMIHWIHADGSTDILSHSKYFSDEALALYARDYSGADPWVNATASPQFVNKVSNLEELVPVEEFMRSDFYNDFVRALGDDTCRCAGVRLDNNLGSGFIALQRGLTQSSFEAQTLAQLSHFSSHLLRMLSIRGQMAASDHKMRDLSCAIDTMGVPTLLVDASLRIRQANAAAVALLNLGSPVAVVAGRLVCGGQREQQRLARAIERTLGDQLAPPTAVPVATPEGQWHDISITAAYGGSARLALLLISHRQRADQGRASRLQALYGLTESESRLAVMLADGMAPEEIASRRNVAIGTVRVQMKQIASKLGCHRQAEIVRTVLNLPPLPRQISSD